MTFHRYRCHWQTLYYIHVNFATRYVFHLFNDRFLTKHHEEVSELLSLFLDAAEARAAAGYILQASKEHHRCRKNRDVGHIYFGGVHTLEMERVRSPHPHSYH